MATYFVGWDVGAWNCEKTKFADGSQDSVVVLKKNCEDIDLQFAWMGNIYEREETNFNSWCDFLKILISDKKNVIFHNKELFNDIEKNKCNFVVAIDAILGCPQAAYNIWNLREPLDNNKNIGYNKANFIYRTTENVIQSTPLSVVKDMLGSQSTKALYLLKTMGMNWNEKTFQWRKDDDIAFETYPAAAASNYATFELLKSKEIYIGKHQGYYDYINKNIIDIKKLKKAKNKYSDFIDALVCAQVATTENLSAPSEKETAAAQKEGWIWLPRNDAKE